MKLEPFAKERQFLFPRTLDAGQLAVRAARYKVTCAFAVPRFKAWYAWVTRKQVILEQDKATP